MDKLEARAITNREAVQPEAYARTFLRLFEEIKDVQADCRTFDLSLFLAEEFEWNDDQIAFMVEEVRVAEEIRQISIEAKHPLELTRHLIFTYAVRRSEALNSPTEPLDS